MKKHESVRTEEISAWIDEPEHPRAGSVSAHIMICNNGWQASGAAMYSMEAAKAALESLTAYVAALEARQ